MSKERNLIYRRATLEDLPIILEMIANDQLGRSREAFKIPLPRPYLTAFEKIEKDPNQEIMVAEWDGEIVGTFQLSYLQYLTYKGGMRVLVEAVRVGDSYRGMGFGRSMFEYIIGRSRKAGAHMVQLTSNKKRKNAIRFYESLGFEASHEGFKYHIE